MTNIRCCGAKFSTDMTQERLIPLSLSKKRPTKKFRIHVWLRLPVGRGAGFWCTVVPDAFCQQLFLGTLYWYQFLIRSQIEWKGTFTRFEILPLLSRSIFLKTFCRSSSDIIACNYIQDQGSWSMVMISIRQLVQRKDSQLDNQCNIRIAIKQSLLFCPLCTWSTRRSCICPSESANMYHVNVIF